MKWLDIKKGSRNWQVRKTLIETLLMGLVQIAGLYLLAWSNVGVQIDSFRAAIMTTILYGIAQSIGWYVFIRFLARLHPLLYPLFTFLISAIFVGLVSFILPGFQIASLWDGLVVVVFLTVFSTIGGVIFGYDNDSWFDFNVTEPLVKKYGKGKTTKEPGFIFFEIDGLSYDILQKAIRDGYMPTLASWMKAGKHTITRWETDLSSQTAAMQAGILQGSNTNIAAYRWYDRKLGRVVNAGFPKDTAATEALLSNKDGLLAKGGSSRGNMFSGDAAENLFTYSTLFDRSRGTSPGFYLFLLSPYVFTRTLTKFVIEVFAEIYDGLYQMITNVRPRVKRIFPYHLLRAMMDSLLPELVTYTAITDMLRGVPAMYLLYPGYDDLGHFSGIDRPDSLRSLGHTDNYIARIERILKKAPRPYHLIILSDHGQSQGYPFRQKYGVTLKTLVESLVSEKMKIYADLETNEAQDLVNAVVTDVSRQNTKSSKYLKKFLRKKTHDGYVDVTNSQQKEKKVPTKGLVILASGSLGLIYATSSKKRMTYEQIELLLPGFVKNLVDHPGIGYVLIDSKKGGIVFGKKGKYYLKTDKIEGENPLKDYGCNAAVHLRKAHAYTTAPDIYVNSAYDPKTGEICGFEEQVGHHGGMGGWQTRPFVLHPSELKVPKEIVGAPALHKVLYGWRYASLKKKRK